MPYDPLASVAPEIHQRARRIGLVCLDVDGTLTDGRLYFDAAGNEYKSFNVHDGQGLTLLRRFGFQVALITARPSLVAQKRGADLGLDTHIGVLDKLACMDELLARALAEEAAFYATYDPATFAVAPVKKAFAKNWQKKNAALSPAAAEKNTQETEDNA